MPGDSLINRSNTKVIVNLTDRSVERKLKKITAYKHDKRQDEQPQIITFKTFGKFDILVNYQSIMNKIYRQQGFIKLLAFFLTNQDRVFSTNTIIEKVWPNKEYHNNDSVVRTQIFRLKRQLFEMIPDLVFQLDFAHGGYFFKLEDDRVIVDTEVFQSICERAFNEDLSLEEQLELCREALDLYHEGFLCEEVFDGDWLLPARQSYRM